MVEGATEVPALAAQLTWKPWSELEHRVFLNYLVVNSVVLCFFYILNLSTGLFSLYRLCLCSFCAFFSRASFALAVWCLEAS